MKKELMEKGIFWFLCFLVYSVAGWIYELGVYYFEFKEGLVNRGFAFGPYLPIYGVGGLLVIWMLMKVKEKKVMVGKVNIMPVICFLIMVIVTSIVELLATYIMEYLYGGWLWDYSMDIPNFQGRIALKSSVRFGIIGMIGLYLLQPVLEKVFTACREKNEKLYHIVSFAVIAIFIIDFAVHMVIGSNCPL